jgi:hypothetical protein
VAQDRRPLTAEDREEISRCLVLNLPNKEIAALLDRDDSVICRGSIYTHLYALPKGEMARMCWLAGPPGPGSGPPGAGSG